MFRRLAAAEDKLQVQTGKHTCKINYMSMRTSTCDPAYPLLPWVMKAFPDNCRLSSQQKTFNYRLSRARVTVEHAYGKLKGRWRCLLKRLDINVSHVPEFVAACCTLHNICEVHGDTFDEDSLEDIGTTTGASTADTGSQSASGDSI